MSHKQSHIYKEIHLDEFHVAIKTIEKYTHEKRP